MSSNRDTIVIEHCMGKPVQVHMVRMPGVFDPGFRKIARAFEKFREGEVNRVADDHYSGEKSITHWFSAMTEQQWDGEVQINGRFMDIMPERIDHSKLDDFFRHIGRC